MRECQSNINQDSLEHNYYVAEKLDDRVVLQNHFTDLYSIYDIQLVDII